MLATVQQQWFNLQFSKVSKSFFNPYYMFLWWNVKFLCKSLFLSNIWHRQLLGVIAECFSKSKITLQKILQDSIDLNVSKGVKQTCFMTCHPNMSKGGRLYSCLKESHSKAKANVETPRCKNQHNMTVKLFLEGFTQKQLQKKNWFNNNRDLTDFYTATSSLWPRCKIPRAFPWPKNILLFWVLTLQLITTV